MDREKIDKLIIYLMAIENYAKDIHYNCSGQDFYGKHLFADRMAENMSGYIDQLKEVCLLGHGFKPLHSSGYLNKASIVVPSGASFTSMQNLMLDTLAHIESITNISKGDENLLGAIAQDLQNNAGLLNIMLGDME